MKKIIFPLLLLAIITSLIIASCSKTYNPQGTVISATSSLNQLFSRLRSTPQSLSVTAGRDTIVYGTKGTMLHFYTNSFKDVNGSIITSGTISLQLIEMYKAGDMICNRATTMANGQILQSGGQITLNATMNGQTVYANAYGIGFKHSNSSSAPMSLFYGGTGNADSVTVWSQADTSKNGTIADGTLTDSIGSGSGPTSFFYFDTCTSFTWANCDWFYTNDSPTTTVSVILPDTSFNENNTQLYLVLPNINRWGGTADTFTAVLSNVEPYLGNGAYTPSTKTMKLVSEGNTSIVPAGLNYDLVVIANKNGTYYYYEQHGVIPHNGLVATAALATDTQADIVSRLSGL